MLFKTEHIISNFLKAVFQKFYLVHSEMHNLSVYIFKKYHLKHESKNGEGD